MFAPISTRFKSKRESWSTFAVSKTGSSPSIMTLGNAVVKNCSLSIGSQICSSASKIVPLVSGTENVVVKTPFSTRTVWPPTQFDVWKRPFQRNATEPVYASPLVVCSTVPRTSTRSLVCRTELLSSGPMVPYSASPEMSQI